MAKVKGTAVRLYINTGSIAVPSYTALEGVTSNTLNINGTEIDVTDMDSNNWKEILPSIRDVSFDFTAYYDDAGTADARIITDLTTAVQPLTKVEFKTLDSKTYAVDGYCMSVSLESSFDNVVVFSGNFVGTGAPTIS